MLKIRRFKMELYKDEIASVLVSEEEIKEICARLGKQISEDYKCFKGCSCIYGRYYAQHNL